MALTKVNTDLLEDGGKLDGIEAGADVTDTTNVTAAGALMDSELTSEASVKALNQGVATTDSPTFAGLNASGDLTLDVAGDIILDADGADVILKDGGTGFLEIDKDGDNARLKNPIADGDIKIQGIDGASTITALTLDMSAAGAATFNSSVRATQLEAYKTNHGGDVSVAANQLGNAYENLASTASLILGATATSTINSTKIVADHSGGATNNHVQDLVFYPVGGSSQNFEAMRISSLGALTVKNAANGHTVFNENGVDANFRVESDTIANALFVDGASGNVSIGSSTAYGTSKLSLFAATNPTTASSSAIQLSIGEASQNSSYSLKVGYINIGGGYSSSIQSIAGGNPSTLLLNADGGKVGIGTSAPNSNFEVQGTFAVRTSTSSTFNDSSNAENVRMLDAGTIFNADGIDKDFTVQSNDNANMLFVDGGNNRIGFGLSNPAQSFAVQFATADRVGTFYDTGTNGNSMYNGAAVLGVSRSSNGSTSLNGPIFEVGRDNGLNATYNVSDSFLTVRSDSTVINEDSQDHDFRVESDSAQYALFVDASNDVTSVANADSINAAFADKARIGFNIDRAGIDDHGGHMFMTQLAAEDAWMDICQCHDANATGVLFFIHGVRGIDQNRSYGAMVRYAYQNAFNVMSVNQQNTTIEYRVSNDMLQYRFTTAGPYIVNLTVMAAG